uniref:Protein kinase domain-containing protein n=1 Tax=Strigamia maritima TaxID=126957 RepID=T1IQQ8_STRMM
MREFMCIATLGYISAWPQFHSPSRPTTHVGVYLIDFGITESYVRIWDRFHNSSEPNPKCAHFGTSEFASCDAHLGRFSRRSDLEMLAYTMLKLSSGKLPWEAEVNLDDCEAIKAQKIK